MINYGIIDASIQYYETWKFKRIESPWTVTEEISNITKPTGAREFKLVHENGKVLVASGEQSFLYLYLKGFLPKGMYQTVTPCWRFENFDPLHTKYFIKNELIITDRVTEGTLAGIIARAKIFFGEYIPFKDIDIVNTGHNAYDLQYKGDELGSYGIRKCDFLEWVYGTGVAEPRLSQILHKHGLSSKNN